MTGCTQSIAAQRDTYPVNRPPHSVWASARRVGVRGPVANEERRADQGGRSASDEAETGELADGGTGGPPSCPVRSQPVFAPGRAGRDTYVGESAMPVSVGYVTERTRFRRTAKAVGLRAGTAVIAASPQVTGELARSVHPQNRQTAAVCERHRAAGCPDRRGPGRRRRRSESHDCTTTSTSGPTRLRARGSTPHIRKSPDCDRGWIACERSSPRGATDRSRLHSPVQRRSAGVVGVLLGGRGPVRDRDPVRDRTAPVAVGPRVCCRVLGCDRLRRTVSAGYRRTRWVDPSVRASVCAVRVDAGPRRCVLSARCATAVTPVPGRAWSPSLPMESCAPTHTRRRSGRVTVPSGWPVPV